MKRVAGILVLAASCVPRQDADEHAVDRTIKAGGVERTYRLHVPPSYSKDRPAPLAFCFHGGGGRGRHAETMSRFDAMSDREGFIAVYPDALDKNWNDGRDADTIKSQKDAVDDVGFIRDLIDALSKEYVIDSKRVYATGISNGAFFSHYLGLKLSDRFAAIAPVAGGIAEPTAKAFKPEHPVSVLILQGTKDPLVPFDGGDVARDRGRLIPTRDAVKTWIAANACKETPVESDVADKDARDGCTVKRAVYSGGKDGAEIVLYTIDGGGHTWPGGRQYLPKAVVGAVCRDFDASETIWEFFKNHPRP